MRASAILRPVPELSKPNALRIGPLGAAFAYVTLTFAQLLPLSLRFTSHLPPGRIDLWQNLWNFWWWKYCSWGLERNPLHTDMVFYPLGTDVLFHTHSFFNMFISAPVNLALGEAAAYNFSIFFAVASAGFFAYLLIRDLTSNDAAAFLGGLIYAFLPQRMEFITDTLNLLSSQFVPLTLLFFRRSAIDGGLRNVCGLGIAFALNAYCDWHHAVQLTLLLLACAGYFLWTRPRPILDLFLDWALAGTLAAVLLSPILFPMAKQMLSGEGYFQKPQRNKGIDPAFLFLPHFRHPLFGWISARLYWRSNFEAEVGMGCFLGYSLMGLNLYALYRNKRIARKWWVMFAVTLILALGANLRLLSRTLLTVPLPFAAFEHLPLLSFLRVANRFFVLSGLTWAIISAIAAISLLRNSRKAWLALYAVVLFEFAWVPFSIQPVPTMPGLRMMQSDPTPGAVLDIPIPTGIRQTYSMLGQVYHERAISGGYLSTRRQELADYNKNHPVLANLWSYDPPAVTPFDLDGLREMGFAFIVLHRDRTTGLARMIREEDGPTDLYQRRINGAREGLSAEKYQIIYDEMVRQTGKPYFEDEDTVIFKIVKD